MSAKTDRRARKRDRRDADADERYWAQRADYIRSRIVCDTCGQEQPFRVADPHQNLAPCDGPLGLPCSSETARFLDYYPIPEPEPWEMAA